MRLIQQRVDSVCGETRDSEVGYNSERELVVSEQSVNIRSPPNQMYVCAYSWVFFSSSLKTCLSRNGSMSV